MLNYVPMYGTLWAYACASQELDPLEITKEQVKARIDALELSDLKFYNENTHFSITTLPNYVEDMLAKSRKPYSKSYFPLVEDEIDHGLKLAKKLTT